MSNRIIKGCLFSCSVLWSNSASHSSVMQVAVFKLIKLLATIITEIPKLRLFGANHSFDQKRGTANTDYGFLGDILGPALTVRKRNDALIRALQHQGFHGIVSSAELVRFVGERVWNLRFFGKRFQKSDVSTTHRYCDLRTLTLSLLTRVSMTHTLDPYCAWQVRTRRPSKR